MPRTPCLGHLAWEIWPGPMGPGRRLASEGKSVGPEVEVLEPLRGIGFTLSPLPPSPWTPERRNTKNHVKRACFAQICEKSQPRGCPLGHPWALAEKTGTPPRNKSQGRGMQSDKPSLTSSRSPFHIIPSHYNVPFLSQSLRKRQTHTITQ